MPINHTVGSYSNGISQSNPTSEDRFDNHHDSSKSNYDQLLPGQGNLWGSILDSVSNNREKSNVPTRKVIVLGDRCSGKSSMVSYLSASNPPPTEANPNGTVVPIPVEAVDGDVDMGTSYTTVEIGDDGDDDPLVRLSMHQIPSALPPYSNLLPLILSADSLRESLILVLIPFTHPHSLLTSLVRWLVLIQSVIKSIKDTIKPAEGGKPAERAEYIIEESKEALEHQYRSYVEPVGQQPPIETNNEGTNSNIHLDLPLPPGTLTENMGIGIIVVCTKSDQIDQLEKEKDFKEEQFDFIQQVLRSICLRFGGSLFFTSSKKPQTLIRLRSYVLHRLFGQLVSTRTTGSGTVTNSKLFQFPYKANVVDRDEVLIPMGWDSWGKIKILRDGFDPSVVGNGWLFDLQKPHRLRIGIPGQEPSDHSTNEEDQVDYDSQGRKIVSACKLWEDMIGETDDDIPSNNPHDRVVSTQEQQFLRTKYEMIKKEKDADPRSHFQLNPKSHSSSHHQQAVKFANGTLLADKDGLSLNSSGLNCIDVQEEMNAQLNKLSQRDQLGNSNGRSMNPNLSPVELLHLQQQQLNQTPRSVYNKTNSTAATMPASQRGGTMHSLNPSSPLSSRSNANQYLNSSLTGTPGGSNPGQKAMLANFFGKLYKDASGARALSSSVNSSTLVNNSNSTLNQSTPTSNLSNNPPPEDVHLRRNSSSNCDPPILQDNHNGLNM